MKFPGRDVSGSWKYKSGIQGISRSWRCTFESHQHTWDKKLFKSRGYCTQGKRNGDQGHVLQACMSKGRIEEKKPAEWKTVARGFRVAQMCRVV